MSDYSRPDSGINTVEGNVAGSVAAKHSKKRQLEQQAFEAKKQKIKADKLNSSSKIGNKFNATNVHETTSESVFREATVGLTTASDFKIAREKAERSQSFEAERIAMEEELNGAEAVNEAKFKEETKRKKKLKREKKKLLSTLSFAGEEEGDDDEDGNDNDDSGNQQFISKKNPNVKTDFLPDKQREVSAKSESDKLKREWLKLQSATKDEKLQITYSYWDGTGHRREIIVKKGNTIGIFLAAVQKTLSKEFKELASSSSDALIYVKEDLMIPQDITFYDLIATSARGKSGPLFNFDVKDDIRVGAIDSRVEKDESHPGKIVERRWYDRNKHIFPASRWEVYDPRKEYGGYTIGGGEVTQK